MPGWGALHFALNAFKAVEQQILQVPSHTVYGEQTQVVNMQVAVFVSPTDFGWVNFVEPVFRRDV